MNVEHVEAIEQSIKQVAVEQGLKRMAYEILYRNIGKSPLDAETIKAVRVIAKRNRRDYPVIAGLTENDLSIMLAITSIAAVETEGFGEPEAA